MNLFIKNIRSHFLFLSYAPIVFVSALKNERVHTLFEQIKIVYENYNRRLQTNVVTDVILDANLLNPAPEVKGTRLKIYYATQVASCPSCFANGGAVARIVAKI